MSGEIRTPDLFAEEPRYAPIGLVPKYVASTKN